MCYYVKITNFIKSNSIFKINSENGSILHFCKSLSKFTQVAVFLILHSVVVSHSSWKTVSKKAHEKGDCRDSSVSEMLAMQT